MVDDVYGFQSTQIIFSGIFGRYIRKIDILSNIDLLELDFVGNGSKKVQVGINYWLSKFI